MTCPPGGFAESAAFRARAMGQGPRETRGDESHDSWALEEKARETVDAKEAARQARKAARLVGEARLREPAARVEGMTHMPERKLGKGRVARLAEHSRVGDDEVLVAISKTGRGKSLVAQAIGSAGGRCPRATSGRPTPAQGPTGRAWPRAAPASSRWTSSGRPSRPSSTTSPRHRWRPPAPSTPSRSRRPGRAGARR